MTSFPMVRDAAPRVLALAGLALLWQGCGGEDVGLPPTGQIEVTVTTTGDEPDPDGYTLSLDGLQGAAIEANASRSLEVDEGSHTLELGGLAENCAVQGPARVDVQVAAGGMAEVAFNVVCSTTTGTITVSTATAGSAADPDGYTLTLDQGQPQPIGPNATLSITGLAPGDHTLLLADVADNCTVAGQNPRAVTVTAGAATDVAFQVACTGAVQQWTPMTSRTRADLADVWGTSATDVFAVGELDTEERISSVILHYDGSAWTRQLDQTDLILRGVWAASPADAYAVGFELDSPDAQILHFDGARWAPETGLVPAESETFTLASVWGSSAGDVFAVGAAFNGEFELALILHFDGSSWQRMAVASQVSPTLKDVWGTSASDVYAVGLDDTADPSVGVVLHFDGIAWTPVLQHQGFVPNAVWADAPSDVFVVGFQVDPGGDFDPKAAVWHFDGSTWSPMTVPTEVILHEVWGTGSSDVFAVGEGGVILHFDGTAWSAVTPTRRILLGVWGSSPADVFAVGFTGTILHGTP